MRQRIAHIHASFRNRARATASRRILRRENIERSMTTTSVVAFASIKTPEIFRTFACRFIYKIAAGVVGGKKEKERRERKSRRAGFRWSFFRRAPRSRCAVASSIATYFRGTSMYAGPPIGRESAVCRTFIASATLRAFSGLRRYI